MKEIKEIKELTLHKDESLYRLFAECSQDGRAISDIIKLIEGLQKVDYNALRLTPYDKGILTEIKRGHWDIYRKDCSKDKNSKNISTFKLPSDMPFLVARSPLNDVKVGTVAIDFGTKSTVAGFIDERSEKQLIRIGKGDIIDKETMSDYENPTIIEFRNIDSFMVDYFSMVSRPLTSWDDILISHTAKINFDNIEGVINFDRFFHSLKQWAGSAENDKVADKHKRYDLKPFLECDENSINPIELYAYYIGRYINNMYNGIYLNYLLSYPVKYSKEVREKIRESFERGIKKSIPFAVLNDEECAKKFKVELRAPEPAAYAISALKEYGFYDEDYVDKVIHYGVFDFGGGTTDFDFGTWKGSETDGYDFDIRQLGDGGDPHLGGENLLELLAYRIFKKNAEQMREAGCAFTKPKNEPSFGGSEMLIQNTSQAAKRNTVILVEYLREFWEGKINFEAAEGDNIITPEIPFYYREASDDSKLVVINIDLNEAKSILKTEIKGGVEGFYQSFKRASRKMNNLDKLHVFLAGNSSRSVLLKEAFDELLEEHTDLNFEIYPPLGTPESDEKKRELGIEVEAEEDFSKKATCKTGVVFGLLDGRKAGRINVIPRTKSDDEGNFTFFLGKERIGKFIIAIDPMDVNIGSEDWKKFANCNSESSEFEILYTSDPKAISNKMSVKDVKRLHFSLDKTYENAYIAIQVTGVDTIKYAVFRESQMVYGPSQEIKLTAK